MLLGPPVRVALPVACVDVLLLGGVWLGRERYVPSRAVSPRGQHSRGSLAEMWEGRGGGGAWKRQGLGPHLPPSALLAGREESRARPCGVSPGRGAHRDIRGESLSHSRR